MASIKWFCTLLIYTLVYRVNSCEDNMWAVEISWPTFKDHEGGCIPLCDAKLETNKKEKLWFACAHEKLFTCIAGERSTKHHKTDHSPMDNGVPADKKKLDEVTAKFDFKSKISGKTLKFPNTVGIYGPYMESYLYVFPTIKKCVEDEFIGWSTVKPLVTLYLEIQELMKLKEKKHTKMLLVPHYVPKIGSSSLTTIDKGTKHLPNGWKLYKPPEDFISPDPYQKELRYDLIYKKVGHKVNGWGVAATPDSVTKTANIGFENNYDGEYKYKYDDVYEGDYVMHQEMNYEMLSIILMFCIIVGFCGLLGCAFVWVLSIMKK